MAVRVRMAYTKGMSKTDQKCPSIAAGSLIRAEWNPATEPPQWETTLPCGECCSGMCDTGQGNATITPVD